MSIIDYDARRFCAEHGMSEDFYDLIARRPDALTHYKCVICEKDLFNRPSYFVELVDPWGDAICFPDGSINGGYFCSSTCMRKLNRGTRGKP